ncbi:hypothetical protein BDZ45DRAFT_671255 [Acephala macrosclerotiorum]|nr:hypothetical protein BDZ45DRAFT_671255 [Acephala macrosclerotiorum]
MSTGSVQANITRLSSESQTSFDTYRRETVEAKLYYMRDTLDNAAFDDLVEKEIQRSMNNSDTDIDFKVLARKIKNKLSKLFYRIAVQ